MKSLYNALVVSALPQNPGAIGNMVLMSALLASSIAVFPTVGEAAGFEILRPHRAIYEISLNEASERSGISNLTGRIVYEMTGNECDGISVRYRFVSQVNSKGEIFTTDQQTSSYETPDSKEYNFLTKSLVNDQLDKIVKGVATKLDGGVQVKLSSPEEKEIDLPKGDFLSQHLIKVIENARQGVSFFKTDVFDGGDGADEILKTTTVIGKPAKTEKLLPGEKTEAIADLGKENAWPVTIGYFNNLITDSSESLPVYEVSFLLYEGGVSRALTMRYPDYSITGTLVSLEMLERKACTINN